jgi:ubiquinone/menaquinone biosynthesis C-methylase UbiE
VSGRAASAGLDYDSEAARYDETRGGLPRARAAAEAVMSLVPPGGVALDVAGGTGIVSKELAAAGFRVVVGDLSSGMLRLAAERLPGCAAVSRAERLPVRDGSVDLVTTIWLLHLLPVPVADVVLAEAARVLRPRGHLVTTVDKDLAHGRARRTNADHRERVAAVAARHGLGFVGGSSFAARTKWRSAEQRQVFAVSAFRKE